MILVNNCEVDHDYDEYYLEDKIILTVTDPLVRPNLKEHVRIGEDNYKVSKITNVPYRNTKEIVLKRTL